MAARTTGGAIEFGFGVVNVAATTGDMAKNIHDGLDDAAKKEAAPGGKKIGDKAGEGFNKGFQAVALAAVGVTLARAAVDFAQTNIEALGRIDTIAAQTDSALASTGASAWVTRDHIDDLAGGIEKLTATEAESVTEGANMLLTFKNVQNGVGEGNDIFDQGVGVMTDMARAMGTDVAGGAVQLGKALNDPIAGVAALGRVGVQFTEDQKGVIASLVESGDLMGAQKIILAELQGQFGGSGAAYAETYAGKLDSVANSWGNLGEVIFTAAMPALMEVSEFLLGAFTFLGENEPLIWTLVSVIGVGMVAAFTAWAASIWMANAALLANPATWIILGIVAAVAGLVVGIIWLANNWSTAMAGMSHGVNGLVHGVNGLIRALNGTLRLLESIFSLGGTLGDWNWGQIGTVGLIDVPGLAEGGTVTRPGTTLVGERGPELLNLPTGSTVIPLDGSVDINGGGGPSKVVNLNISNPLGEKTSDSVRAASQLVGAAL